MPVKTVTLQVTALTKEANAQLLGIRKNTQALIDQNPVELKVKLEAAGARAELAVLRREINRPVDAGGGGQRGLLGLLGGAAGSAAPGAAASGIGIGIAGLGALAIAAAQAGAALAAAAAGFAAFGALAIPTLTKLLTTSRALKDVKIVFASLVAALRPDVVRIFNQAMRILLGLLPQLLPFAKATATAIEGLLKGFAGFAASNGFKVFLDQLGKLTGPAITALGQGLGRIAIAVGKLILVAAQPNSIKVLTGLLDLLVIAINVVTFVVGRASGKIIEWKNDFADIGRVVSSWVKNTTAAFAAFGRDVVAIFNALSQSAGSAWNILWHVLVTDTVNGIRSIAGWFGRLPGDILGALRGLGHTLGSFASAALNEMWNGFKNIAGSIFSWFTNFGHTIINVVKKVLGIFSPSSVFYDIGKNLMLGLRNGVIDHVHHAQNAARAAAQAVGAQGGPTSASAAQAQAYARSRLAAYGWGSNQMASLIALWNQESGWNRLARNPTSGAYGIPQALPPSKMGAAANPPLSSAAAQINWGLGYIKSVYGSPAGAEAHELSAGWYDRGGWLPTGLSLALNTTGRPERVGGGEQRIVIEWTGGNAGDELFAWIRRNIRIRGGNVQTVLGRN